MNNPVNNPPGRITRIGKYDVIDELGRGGMGVVYRGIDKHIGREVAIKTLTQGFMGDPNMLARFYDEGRRTGRLKHPNIVTVYDLGDDNGMPYIVMECVEGDPLDKLIRAEMPLSMVEKLRIIEDTCSALGYAHRNNVIHRDVKPANIFVQPDGNVKLLDFGIARLEKQSGDISLTRTGSVIGTVPYIAPERLQNLIVDGRSDIFAAGVVLFQLLTGQLPFNGEDLVLMQKILNEPHPPLSSRIQGYPAALDMIIDRALAKSADDRYSTAEEMAADLSTVIAELRLEEVHRLLSEARSLMNAGEHLRARGLLQQVLKIQSRNIEAREMLNEIQVYLTQRQREERIQQIRVHVEEALRDKRFDEGLNILAEGLNIDSANAELQKLRSKILKEKEKQERINENLREADAARRRGDYKSAIAAAQKALKTDKNNSRILALYNLLTREAEHAQKQAEARTLLDSARNELGARRYSEALALLKQIETLDPTNAELPLLLSDANFGLDQIKRREVVSRIEEKVALATSYVQLQQALKAIEEAMATMPGEAVFFPLKADVERQIEEYENRRLVDDTVHACRNLSPRAALEIVKEARRRLPGDERLLALEAMLIQRVEQQSLSEHQSEITARAREVLRSDHFTECIRILESAQSDGIANSEMLSLLEFARAQDAEQRRLQLLHSNLERGEALIRDAAYDEAILFLEGTLQDAPDPALRVLLEQAIGGRDVHRQQIQSVLNTAHKLVQNGKHTQALQLFDRQPATIQASERMKLARTAIHEDLQQSIFRTVGRGYARMESDLPAGEETMRRVLAASGHTTLAIAIVDAFRLRARAVADSRIGEILNKARTLLRNRDRVAAGALAQDAASLADYASPHVVADWRKLTREIEKPGVLRRLRG